MSFLISGAKERPKLGHQSLAAQGCLVDSKFPEISDFLVPSSVGLKQFLVTSILRHTGGHGVSHGLPTTPWVRVQAACRLLRLVSLFKWNCKACFSRSFLSVF